MPTIRPVTTVRASVLVEPGVTQWAIEDQIWAEDGVHLQIRRTADRSGVHVVAEAVVKATGELIASAPHTALIHDRVRRHVAMQLALAA